VKRQSLPDILFHQPQYCRKKESSDTFFGRVTQVKGSQAEWRTIAKEMVEIFGRLAVKITGVEILSSRKDIVCVSALQMPYDLHGP
jgi:hypothetical protein